MIENSTGISKRHCVSVKTPRAKIDLQARNELSSKSLSNSKQTITLVRRLFNWGEPERAPHTSMTALPEVVCMYVCGHIP